MQPTKGARKCLHLSNFTVHYSKFWFLALCRSVLPRKTCIIYLHCSNSDQLKNEFPKEEQFIHYNLGPLNRPLYNTSAAEH
uniref:Uncharacterized protein n=1 Tax=Physcomitrium patens TaxID=3218 RepID=A0A2K1JYV1_PHYPA|nr:hypothetical protein PHYPA_013816 [Physcomitrium patens]